MGRKGVCIFVLSVRWCFVWFLYFAVDGRQRNGMDGYP